MRWVLFTLFAVLAGASAFIASSGLTRFRGLADSNGQQPLAETSAESALVFAEGTVEGAGPELHLKFEVAGRVQAVHVREGDTVRAGDLLAELEPDLAALRLAEARAQLRIAMAQRDALVEEARRLAREGALAGLPTAEQQALDAEAALERLQEEGRQQTISRRSLEQTRQKRDQALALLQRLRDELEVSDAQVDPSQESIAEARIALAEAAVKRERLLLEKCRLRSPIDAVVVRATPQPGEVADPADHRGGFILANRGGTRIRAFVEEFDAPRVAPGKRALMTTSASRGKRYRGTVAFCAPALLPKQQFRLKPGERIDLRMREIIIDVEHGDDLLIGMPVEVFIEP